MMQRIPIPSHMAFALLASAAVLFTLGCNRGPKMAPVSGKVTFEGKAVPEGTVTFYPQEGGRPSTGQLQADGSYSLSSTKPGDGAILGNHVVAIEARRVKNAPPAPKTFEEELAQDDAPMRGPTTKIEWLVPIEFSSSETSGLTATVENKDNVINFDLP